MAEIYGPKLGREIDPNTEIVVTVGANGSLNSFIMGLINKGDELVCFEPAFPCIFDHCVLAGGDLKTVPLYVENGDWVFDPEVFRSTLNENTKLLILNSPHNPTGKVFSRKELETISKILQDFLNVVVLSDEVYSFLTYDENEHIPFSTIGDNWDRTISTYSGGKLMHATGWKVGWSIGP